MPPRKSSGPTYLVSGDDNIKPSHKVLRKTGRRVQYDNEVGAAAQSMRARRRYVVVAHGRRDGTVMWYRSEEAKALRWLWVAMESPPREARIYLYACEAGRRLPRSLKHCECFGHVGVVPMPVGASQMVVLRFLTWVDELMQKGEFSVDGWRKSLKSRVAKAWAAEVERRKTTLDEHALLRSAMAASTWLTLLESFGADD